MGKRLRRPSDVEEEASQEQMRTSPSSDSQDTEDNQSSTSEKHSEQHLEAAPVKKKRIRTLTTPHQAAVLHATLAQSQFPTTAMREEVGRSIGLSVRKVQIWFQNQRLKARRSRKELDESAHPSQYGLLPVFPSEAHPGSHPIAPGSHLPPNSQLPPMTYNAPIQQPCDRSQHSSEASTRRSQSTEPQGWLFLPGVPDTDWCGPSYHGQVRSQTVQSQDVNTPSSSTYPAAFSSRMPVTYVRESSAVPPDHPGISEPTLIPEPSTPGISPAPPDRRGYIPPSTRRNYIPPPSTRRYATNISPPAESTTLQAMFELPGQLSGLFMEEDPQLSQKKLSTPTSASSPFQTSHQVPQPDDERPTSCDIRGESTATAKLLQRASSDSLSYILPSRHCKASSPVRSILNNDAQIIKTLQIAAHNSPIPTVATAASLALSILEIVQSLKIHKEDFSFIGRDACSIVWPIVKRLQTGPQGSQNDLGTLHHAEILVVDLEYIERRVKEVKLRTSGVRKIFGYRPHQDTIRDCRERLTHAITMFSFQHDLGIYEQVDNPTTLLEASHHPTYPQQPSRTPPSPSALPAAPLQAQGPSPISQHAQSPLTDVSAPATPSSRIFIPQEGVEQQTVQDQTRMSELSQRPEGNMMSPDLTNSLSAKVQLVSRYAEPPLSQHPV